MTQNDNESRDKALKAAYTAATSRLRQAHRSEFDTLYTEEAKARGVEYERKPTPEEKAEAEVRDLLTKYPSLREKVLADAEAGDEHANEGPQQAEGAHLSEPDEDGSQRL